MTYPAVTLKPQRPDRWRHPWVYDNEIQKGPDAGFTPGGLVRVLDSRGKPHGIGYCNPKSKIAIRYLTRNYQARIDDAFWRERIQAAYEYRKARWAATGLPGAFRLVHGEADGIPGLVADVYGGFAVVQFLALGLEPWRDVLVAAIAETTGAVGVYERSDSAVRRLEGLEEQVGLLFGEAPPDLLEIDDEGAVLLADLKTGAKTGLFLDQRENQIAAAREAAGRDVLNCFSYTGLFGLRAAKAGAARVTDVEISPAFNALNARQWERNGLSLPHETVSDNVFDRLRALEAEKAAFDLIVLDPPAFTKNRASREGAVRGYNEINRMALRLLRPQGVLVTCSCSHHLDAGEFREVIQAASHDAGRTLRLIEQRGQPADHPVLLDVPETEYLKCLIFGVE